MCIFPFFIPLCALMPSLTSLLSFLVIWSHEHSQNRHPIFRILFYLYYSVFLALFVFLSFLIFTKLLIVCLKCRQCISYLVFHALSSINIVSRNHGTRWRRLRHRSDHQAYHYQRLFVSSYVCVIVAIIGDESFLAHKQPDEIKNSFHHKRAARTSRRQLILCQLPGMFTAFVTRGTRGRWAGGDASVQNKYCTSSTLWQAWASQGLACLNRSAFVKTRKRRKREKENIEG